MNQPAKDAKDVAKEQDQSMEEILQSIKRIIAEEDDVGAVGSDILELTDIIDEPAVVEAPAVADAPEDDVADLDMDQIMALRKAEAEAREAAEKATAEVPPPPAPEPEPVAVVDEESWVSDTTAQAAAEAFDVLKNLPDPLPTVPRLDSMALRSGATVEDLVLEALRPMLRDWLDANLTEIVQRIVEREVRKITAR